MKKILSILLCLVSLMGLLSGCSVAHAPQAYEPTGSALEQEEAQIEETQAEEEVQTLSLAYYAEQSMNPLVCADFTNRVFMPLIYQSLFSVDRNNQVIPILCKSYSVSADLMSYDFTIDPKATFSDGTPVTPEDVVASLEKARNNKYYGGRLRYVGGFSVTDDREVRVYLYQPNSNLPLLLDIPIVKADQVDAETPLGSGPYVLGGWGKGRYLTRRADWWCKSKDLLVTVEKIYLVNAESTTSIRDAFEFYDVGLVCTDPGSDRYVEYRCDYELWDCETGIFVYLGINSRSSVFENRAIRQAISKGIDRELLVERYYRGFAHGAELPASPNSPYYSPALAQKYAYDPIAYQEAVSALKGRVIKLLVNDSDSLRVKVAQEIGRMLNTSGVLVEVVKLSSSRYENALNEGDYDMYLGQTKLSPNMDLSAFFSENGALNYGGMSDAGMYTASLKALENQGEYYNLYQSIMEDAYLCPVLFRSYAVYAARGILTDLQPARDNLFCYSIGRTLTDTYVIGGL